MNTRQVLVVENQQIVALDLEVCLEALGFTVAFATTGEEATHKAEQLKPDLVLMDIGLDGPIDGIQAAEWIRKETNIPLIFLTAYADSHTVKRAAQVDPSSYIVKPFKETELAAAVYLALHRRGDRSSALDINTQVRAWESPRDPAPVFRLGDLQIDFNQRRVFDKETEIRLTNKEFRILQCLAERPGVPVSPETLLTRVWGPQFVHYTQTLRVHIGNLRQKIESTCSSGVMIEGVRGVGYRLMEKETPSFSSSLRQQFGPA